MNSDRKNLKLYASKRFCKTVKKITAQEIYTKLHI